MCEKSFPIVIEKGPEKILPLISAKYNNEGEMTEAKVWRDDDIFILQEGEFEVIENYIKVEMDGQKCVIHMETYNPKYSGNTHELKTLPGYFMALIDNRKPFEVRKNDRNFKVNDLLILKEWNEEAGYTGNQLIRKISYILEGGKFGVEKDYVVLGLQKVR